MFLPGETLSETYPAVPDSVARARNALTAFAEEAGADPRQLDAVRLAASEAVTNAVMHAYTQGQTGAVHVSASYVEDELWVLIADTGGGLRPRSNSPGLGLGLAVIAQLADEFQILSRGSGGTELRLRFELRSSNRRSEPPSPDSGQRRPAPADRAAGSAQVHRGSVSTALSAA
jgi:serine/threonine-protein kinase RsbW